MPVNLQVNQATQPKKKVKANKSETRGSRCGNAAKEGGDMAAKKIAGKYEEFVKGQLLTEDAKECYQSRDDVRLVEMSVQISKAIPLTKDWRMRRGVAEYYMAHVCQVLTKHGVSSPYRVEAVHRLAFMCRTQRCVRASAQLCSYVDTHVSDRAVTVRKGMVQIIRVLVLETPELLDHYYAMLTDRIADKYSCVKKEVIKTFAEFAIEHNYSRKIPDMLLRILTVRKDEDTVEPLVQDVFRWIWLTMEPRQAARQLAKTVAVLLQRNELAKLEQIVLDMYKPGERKVMEAHQQLITAVLKEIASQQPPNVELALTATLRSLFKPQQTITPDNLGRVVKTLSIDQGKPSMILEMQMDTLRRFTQLLGQPQVQKHAASLQETLLRLILEGSRPGITGAIPLLYYVTKATGQTDAVFTAMKSLRAQLEKIGRMESLNEKQQEECKQSLYLYSLLLQHCRSDRSIKLVQGVLFDYINHKYDMIAVFALKAIGNVSLRYLTLYTSPLLRRAYHKVFREPTGEKKIQVLENLEKFLVLEAEYASTAITDLVHEVMQEYMSDVINTYYSSDINVRRIVLRLVHFYLDKGQPYINKAIPCVIAMGTDPSEDIRTAALARLVKVQEKYPNSVYTRALEGLKASYRLQKLTTAVALGYNNYEALLSQLYNELRTKHERRAFMFNLLLEFVQPKPCLDQIWFFAENIAYFPYQTVDEVLTVIYSINAILVVQGYDSVELAAKDPSVEVKKQHLILLKLLRHLQDRYQYSDNTIYSYSPWVARLHFERPCKPRKYLLFPRDYTKGIKESAESWLAIWDLAHIGAERFIRRNGIKLT